jgi:heme exporter protein A
VTASNSLFTLKNISCRRGGRILFQNLSLTVAAREVVQLSGPNGTGKTSLLRIMAGALPSEGDILWNNEGFLENGAAAHASRFAFLPADDKYLKPLETGRETLAFWARLTGIAPAAVDDALAAVALTDLRDRAVKYFSSGQRRRLGLARILMQNAPLWLLDEPLNGLDADSAALFRAALDRHVASGGMAVIASHLPVDPPAQGTLRRIVLSPPERMAA